MVPEPPTVPLVVSVVEQTQAVAENARYTFDTSLPTDCQLRVLSRSPPPRTYTPIPIFFAHNILILS